MSLHFINCTRETFLNEYKRLYRFTTLDRFFEMQKSGRYPFVSPLKWNDPYEKYFLERDYEVGNKRYALPIKDKIYSSCLSATSNSEAYWNVYAPNSDGIRLGFESSVFLTELLDKIEDADVYVGPIQYFHTLDFTKKGIDTSRLSACVTSQQDIPYQIELMYRKRSAFLYEDEIRIMILPKKELKKNDEIDFPFEITKHAMDITLDPRIGKNHFQFIKDNLQRDHQIRISRAALYKEITPGPFKLG